MPRMSNATLDSAVIFDLDGTLADTLDDLTDALNTTFDELGYARVESDRLRMMVGDGLPALLERASETDDPQVLAAILDHYRGVYSRTMLNRTTLFDGVGPMLDRLAERKLNLAVLSNKSHEFTVRMCEVLLENWPFRQVQGMTEEALKKPDPTFALRIARKLERPAEQVYFVGDSSVDVETGRRAGMKTIGVTWGLRDRAHLVAAGPDYVVDTPDDVAEIILQAT